MKETFSAVEPIFPSFLTGIPTRLGRPNRAGGVFAFAVGRGRGCPTVFFARTPPATWACDGRSGRRVDAKSNHAQKPLYGGDEKQGPARRAGRAHGGGSGSQANARAA